MSTTASQYVASNPITLTFASVIALSVTASISFVASCTLVLLFVRLFSRHRNLLRDVEASGILVAQIQPQGDAKHSLLRRLGVSIFQEQESNQFQSPENANFTPLPQKAGISVVEDCTPDSITADRYIRASNRIPMILKTFRTKRLPVVPESSMGLWELNMTPVLPSRRLAPVVWSPRDMDVRGAFPKPECSNAWDPDFSTKNRSELRPLPLFSDSKKCSPEHTTVSGSGRSQTIGDPSVYMRNNHQVDRPLLHKRSLSLCSHNAGFLSTAPTCDMTATDWYLTLPCKPIHRDLKSASRRSTSTIDSTGSLLLTRGPRITRSASIQISKGANRESAKSVIIGSRQISKSHSLPQHSLSWGGHKPLRHWCSVRSRQGRYSSGPSIASPDTPTVEANTMSFNPIDFSKFHTLGTTDSESKIPRSTIEDVLQTTPEIIPRPQRLEDLIRTTATDIISQSPFSTRASSTRSSNGNPFHWDSSPQPVVRPSVLKGSPSARRTHKRRQAVRHHLQPIVHSLPVSCTSSVASLLEGHNDVASLLCKSPEAKADPNQPRSLPPPPSITTFAPDLKNTPQPREMYCSFRPPIPNVSSLNQCAASNLSSQIARSAGVALPAFSSHLSSQIPTLQSPSSSKRRKAVSPVLFSFNSRIFESPQVPIDFLTVVGSTTDSGLRSEMQQNSNRDNIEHKLQDKFQELQPGETIIDFSESSMPTEHSDADFIQLNGQSTTDDATAATEQQETATATIRNSIVCLRRMNSEACGDAKGRASTRRYLSIVDRDGSPIPHELDYDSSPPRYFQWDHAADFVSTTNLTARLLDGSNFGPASGVVSPKAVVSKAQLETKRKEQVPFDMWEEGWNVWGNGVFISTPPRFALKGAGNKMPRALQTPIVKLFPPTEQNTPASLYDENGFFKGEDFRNSL
jgi:hypothetical protein